MPGYRSTFCSVLLIVGSICAHPALAQQPPIDEATIERYNRRFEAEAKIKAPCAMPKASDSAKIVLLRVDGAEALSTVTIGSQDVATGTAAIVVEPGREPLYLIVASMSPTIWRLTGAVERIERLVLASLRTGPNRGVPGEMPLNGATGVASDRITFLRHPHCLSIYQVPSAWVAMAPSIVTYEIGRRPTAGAAFGAIAQVSVPSLAWQSTRRGKTIPMIVYSRSNSGMVIEGDPRDRIIIAGQNDLNEELKLFTPGGVTDIDANAVVASRPPERYAVLPQQAGLLQLLRSGALSRNADGDFLVRREIRLPAELNGGHKLILLRGVPEPAGEPGHVCVLVEETGAPLQGSHC
jgi:hypothetical protein